MAHVTIFGTGNMANAIGGVFAEGGSSVTYISAEESGTAPIVGDIVVLAVPYPAVAGILSAYGEQLAGKTVVDITNPLNFETFDSLVVPAGSSAAAEIQAALPQSSVVKAFNTTFAATLVAKTVGGAPTTVQVAGDSAEAKSALIAAIAAGGVQAIDAGALSRAHELEALGFLQLTLAVREVISWTGGFAVVR
ncbi:MAG: diguanylate cyclase [Microbacterium ginsengisoli]|jgi:8-hydroxy-5-deazaflavin:NADPH oxidoreductase|uniref:NADPH-dependent F420 reductase n=1 Tax=Microbacterium TaxID=33882 RepID=UPI0006FAE110|nr:MULTISPECIES: NAD(P)-binding domain-containing protein [unclassified Microbacterium]MBN9197741.1 diguanylate cyclase [Microbacterium ginsengisoli]KQR92128.1 diguanylate cyclase [Microbacterium sp. Leaf347]KQS05877.1 diguanylate cyclase [Microbacterium sp. Leaf351]ODU79820.1 MAG: diguanylate cyclase [Microbacterium sp. SCN 71-21]OJU79341.1 MAG: diguanylate cyclase [Microbacterium sp. 71-23]